jgi:hypothetical protein
MKNHYRKEQHQRVITNTVLSLTRKLSSEHYKNNSAMNADTSHIDVFGTATSNDADAPIATDDTAVQLHETNERNDILPDEVRALNDHVQRLSTESLRMQNSTET